MRRVWGQSGGKARDWKLRSRSRALLPRPTVIGGEDYDHAEQYRDEAGWFVLVCSNYGDIPPPAIFGLRKVPPLYCEGATSYAGRFASLRELRARLEAVEGAPKFGAGATYSASRPRPAGAHGRGGADSWHRPSPRRFLEHPTRRSGIPHPPRLRA